MSNNDYKAPAYILFLLFALSQSTESTYTAGLPEISIELGIHPKLAQFSSSVYFYGFAFGVFILGRMSDIVGRRPVVFWGLTIFLLSSILSFFASNINSLIILRFTQAFGASIGSVVAQAMARDSYSGTELSRLYATLASGLAIMPAISSLIGGNIVKYLGWRYIFIYLFLVVFIVAIICVISLKETKKSSLYTSDYSFWNVAKHMIKDPKILCYGAIVGSFNGIMYSFYIEAPFIFMSKLSIDPSGYGLIISCLGVSAVCGGLFSRMLQGNGVSGKLMVSRGLFFSIISCIVFFIMSILWKLELLNHYHIKYVLIIPMMMQAVSFSITMPIILRYSLEDYGKVNGTAGSFLGTYYYFIIATINYITSRLHSEDIIKIAFFFLSLSILSNILYRISAQSRSSIDNRFKV